MLRDPWQSVQLVRLDSHIQLLDSPGVLVSSSGASQDQEAQLVLRNCIKVESVEDPVGAGSMSLEKLLCAHFDRSSHNFASVFACTFDASVPRREVPASR